VVIATGISSVVTQLLTIREFLTQFKGNEIVIALILFNWLILGGIGTLLAEGIGDTIRVSLTGDPVQEVQSGYEILKALNIRQHGPTIISCPTCGRTRMDIVSVIEEVEQALSEIDKPITIAIMGCEVNGPGEAKEADIGIACGQGMALMFKKGKVIRKIKEKEMIPCLLSEIKNWG